jgi:hypothetical protein
MLKIFIRQAIYRAFCVYNGFMCHVLFLRTFSLNVMNNVASILTVKVC